MSIAIIIPAFKEADNIERLIFSILKVLNDPIIIIIDDSPDREIQEKIKASKFFIGNECFAYSIAEGLKVPRLLEASPDFPVIFPVGKNAYDFYHQIHFEMLFKKLYKYK
jgi:glycosyltransferase involved in cell wall biosynthesis